jgi:hypothetical protein
MTLVAPVHSMRISGFNPARRSIHISGVKGAAELAHERLPWPAIVATEHVHVQPALCTHQCGQQTDRT